MSTPAPAYPPPTAVPEPPRRRRALVAAVAGWAVVLLVLGYLSFRHDAPTVREQRDIAEASQLVDRATGELAAAATLDPDVAVELPAPRLTRGCRVTPFRDGTTLEREVILRATAEGGSGLLERIAQRLPAAYRAGIRVVDGGPKLRADAGEFVAVKGGFTTPDTAILAVTTGCRPGSPDPGRTEPPASAPADRLPGQVLGALGRPVDRTPPMVVAPCPGGGEARTVRAVAGGPPPPSFADALRPVTAGNAVLVVASQPDRYAYRAGPVSVVVGAADGEIAVAVTTGCPA